MADDAANLAGPNAAALGLLAQAEDLLVGMAAGYDAPALTRLRTLISSYSDMGAPGAGEVAASLFMLLGRFLASGSSDPEALWVHLRAWRLLLSSAPEDVARDQLMVGLRAILMLYADAAAA
jgi:hypothetical protein